MPNMHMYLHLQDILLDYGPASAFWLFSFERYNGILGNFNTNMRNVGPQLMRRFLLNQFVVDASVEATSDNTGCSFTKKIIHFLAQLALLKHQSLQGGVKEMYAKEEIEGAMIQGKVSRTVFDDDEEDHLAKFYEKIFRASSAIVSPTAETGRGILHKEMKLRIRPGKYCMVLATRDGGERRPCFITRFLKHHATISSTANLRKSKHVEVIIAEVSWLEDHPSKGFFWIRHTRVEEDHRATQSTVIHSAGRRSM